MTLFCKKRLLPPFIVLLGLALVCNGCWPPDPDPDPTPEPINEKVGILFLQVGSDETYSFDWMPQFMRNMSDFFAAGQFVGGPLEGADCYTVIHYADEVEAAICGVAQGTPIDVFCTPYTNDDTYPVQSVGDIGLFSYIENCADKFKLFWTQFMFEGAHNTLDPATQTEIAGPIVTDPNGAGRGIEDFMEMMGFDWMRTLYHLPNRTDVHRSQLLKWWYGNDAPGYVPDNQELTNIKDRLTATMPDTQFAFRHGWESYLANKDAYGDPRFIPDSAQTAIQELINDEGVGRVIVVHTYPAFSNMTQYGHNWFDSEGNGISAIDGKTFEACLNDIDDGYGPDNSRALSTYLRDKPLESHWEHPFPAIEQFVKETNADVPVAFAPPYGDFSHFDTAVVDLLDYTVSKYNIPRSASLKVILGHHGYYGGYQKAQECDCYFKKADALYNRVSATVQRNFAWDGKFTIANGAVEYAEGGLGEDDPPTADQPTGAVMAVAEEIDQAINGVYVNSQGELIDNGTDNFEHIIFVPYFFEAESTDTIFGAREVLGNMIAPSGNGPVTKYYLRDDRDADGTEYDAGDLDDENFTVKVYDASGWPSTPVDGTQAVNKGSISHPTTVIVTSTILSLGNGRARDHLTEAAVEAITSIMNQ